MQVDNVASAGVPGFAELGISPLSVEEVLREIVRAHRSSASDAGGMG
jgi:hypothetical protein